MAQSCNVCAAARKEQIEDNRAPLAVESPVRKTTVSRSDCGAPSHSRAASLWLGRSSHRTTSYGLGYGMHDESLHGQRRPYDCMCTSRVRSPEKAMKSSASKKAHSRSAYRGHGCACECLCSRDPASAGPVLLLFRLESDQSQARRSIRMGERRIRRIESKGKHKELIATFLSRSNCD